MDFNPRSHEGSDDLQPIQRLDHNYYFNPRSHEGSDDYKSDLFRLLLISTRAPTRGATPPDSLHQFTLCYFNPRSHEGSDSK